MIRKQLIGLIILFVVSNAFSQPGLPSQFYGTIKINGEDAPIGTKIIPTIDNIEYETEFEVNETNGIGNYSSYVNADNPATSEIKEGGVTGEQVVFKAKIGQTEYMLTPSGTWNNNDTQHLDLMNQGEIPVELSSFRAESKNNSVNLFWTTVSESNNFGFEVQRSRNDNFFNKIAFRNGHGTTNSPQTYNYSDTNLQSGKYFYRLKQIDTDGAFTFSPTLEVNLSFPQTFQLFQNYPNPFNPATNISYLISEQSNIKITIYNSSGQKIKTLVNGIKSAGDHSIVWNGRNKSGNTVSNGIYIYKMSAENFSVSKKLIFMK